jgi:hypothetical protein
MREKYTNNIAYLHKRTATDNTVNWDENGTPFYCNREVVKKSRWNPQANTYAGTAEEVLKTTTQLVFEVNDKITFFSQPLNDVNFGDASLISAIEPIPYMERGNKQLNENYYEYRITIQ